MTGAKEPSEADKEEAEADDEALDGASAEAPAPEPAPPEDARPAFAHDYPRDPDLDALVAAFDRGDYATVRRRAPAVASGAADPRVERAAQDLLRRISPDPLSRLLVLIAAALLVFLSVWYFTHRHEGG
jgi:hypothetical protein